MPARVDAQLQTSTVGEPVRREPAVVPGESRHDFRVVALGGQAVGVDRLTAQVQVVQQLGVHVGQVGGHPAQLVHHAEVGAGPAEVAQPLDRHERQVKGARTREDRLDPGLLETAHERTGAFGGAGPEAVRVEGDVVPEIRGGAGERTGVLRMKHDLAAAQVEEPATEPGCRPQDFYRGGQVEPLPAMWTRLDQAMCAGRVAGIGVDQVHALVVPVGVAHPGMRIDLFQNSPKPIAFTWADSAANERSRQVRERRRELSVESRVVSRQRLRHCRTTWRDWSTVAHRLHPRRRRVTLRWNCDWRSNQFCVAGVLWRAWLSGIRHGSYAEVLRRRSASGNDGELPVSAPPVGPRVARAIVCAGQVGSSRSGVGRGCGAAGSAPGGGDPGVTRAADGADHVVTERECGVGPVAGPGSGSHLTERHVPYL